MWSLITVLIALARISLTASTKVGHSSQTQRPCRPPHSQQRHQLLFTPEHQDRRFRRRPSTLVPESF